MTELVALEWCNHMPSIQ